MGAYNVAKHGVVALMATLERDLRGRKSPVRASVLCPGPDQHRHQPPLRDVPPEPAAPKANSAAEGRAGANVQAALDQGMDPDEVGRIVLDGDPDRPFWVLTHPLDDQAAHRQLDALAADGSLTKA